MERFWRCFKQEEVYLQDEPYKRLEQAACACYIQQYLEEPTTSSDTGSNIPKAKVRWSQSESEEYKNVRLEKINRNS